MKRTIDVLLGEEGRMVGTLRFAAQGARESAVFAYDEHWLGASDAFAIDPQLRLVAGPQFHHRTRTGSVFPGAIADSEPDGWARRVILRDHAKRREEAKRAGRAADAPVMHSLDFLLAVDDRCRGGALRFRDESGVCQRTVPDGRRSAPPLIELRQLLRASHAVERNQETAEDLAYLRGRGTSLGGLRPKCSVVDDDGRLCIGKFPSITDERAVTKGEVLALRLAAAAGIDAAPARLIDSDGLSVALIERFDRAPSGARLMYVSAATLVGADVGDAREHTYTELVDALRVHGAAAQIDIEQLWRRIAFSVLITNVDDHLHNHGFLHAARGLWRLSPAFDVNPFPDRARELKTWISEDTGPVASIDALRSIAPYCRISIQKARRVLREVESVVARWRDVGAALGMNTAELDQFADAFEHGDRAAARA